MKLHKMSLLAVAFAAAFTLTGHAENAAPATPKKKLKLAFVCNNAATFWTIARAGCEDAAKQLGNVSVDFRIPPEAQSSAQQRILNDLVARGVDGIAVTPIDPDNQTAFLDKIASQTLLICHD